MDSNRYQGCTAHFTKGLINGTAHCQFTSGVTDEGNAYCTKGKGDGGLRYENMSPGQGITSSLEELRQFLVFWFSVHDGDDNYV